MDALFTVRTTYLETSMRRKNNFDFSPFFSRVAANEFNFNYSAKVLSWGRKKLIGYFSFETNRASEKKLTF